MMKLSFAGKLVLLGIALSILSILVAAYRVSVHPGPEMQWPTTLSLLSFIMMMSGLTIGFFEWLGHGVHIKVRTTPPPNSSNDCVFRGKPIWK